MRSSSRLALALAGTLAAGGAAQDLPSHLTPREGQPFPAIAFPRLDGKGRASLQDFRGKKILLMQFASW